MVLEGAYSPLQIENKWSQKWEQLNYGAADANSEKPKYSMVMPPPNVTGSLHLGHTMMVAVEDAIARFQRMDGKEVCWVPGTDHAGIATQSVVERHLMKNGVSRHDLGREAFLEKVWDWKNEKGGQIIHQLKTLGTSADWEREAFTMSPMLSSAVVEAFVRMYEKGLVYRANRLVCWSPFLNTALSEIEVDTLEVEKPDRIRIPGYEKTVEVGMLWHFKYPIKGSDEFITVATSRPETMLGDVAVAVNPKDERYQHLIGKEIAHPFLPQRQMIIVADEHCDPEFGTGCVKITPAHDKNDYEIGLRHNLPIISVFTDNGYMINDVELNGEFAGLHRMEARVRVEKRLEELNLLVGKEKNTKKMAIPICSRSGDIVEYMVKPQWYVNCIGMAKKAADAARSGELKFLPGGENGEMSVGEKQWYYWLDNAKDWCVSRQLWWGHRIPAYKAMRGETELGWTVARNAETALQQLKETYGDDITMEQDADVLDTWFSSGLFPFSVFNWSAVEEAKRNGEPTSPLDASLKKFFPTDCLETGGDILFFWVARMVMMSLELTEELPFHTVYLHPIVRDAHGHKMSKSSGNVIDPLNVIGGITLEQMIEDIKSGNTKEAEMKRAIDATKKDFPQGIPECGADALRFGLLSYLKGATLGINLDIQRIVSYRFFCNKLWNATKFALTSVETAGVDKEILSAIRSGNVKSLAASHKVDWSDYYILQKLDECVAKAHAGYAKYAFDAPVDASYSFFLYDFCDVYLELCKGRTDAVCPAVMFHVIDAVLRVMHPAMPFVTEELWAAIYETAKLETDAEVLALSTFYTPEYAPTTLPEGAVCSVAQMNEFLTIVKAFRSMLAQFEVPPKNKLDAVIRFSADHNVDLKNTFTQEKCDQVRLLAKLNTVELVEEIPTTHILQPVNATIIAALHPSDVVDFGKVVKKLEKKLAQTEKLLAGTVKKMSIPNYETKVPAEVQTKNTEALAQYTAEVAETKNAMDALKAFL